MSDTTYIDYVQPAVSAEWLNEINDHVWHNTPVSGSTVHAANNIAHTPSGTLVATDVQGAIDALDARNIITVITYGAVGDGLADDTAAIQAAHDALPATGGNIIFPPGFYNLAVDGVYVNITKPNVTLIGPSAWVISPNSSDAEIKTGTRYLNGFIVTGNNCNISVNLRGPNITWNPGASTDNLFLRNMIFKNMYVGGVYVNGTLGGNVLELDGVTFDTHRDLTSDAGNYECVQRTSASTSPMLNILRVNRCIFSGVSGGIDSHNTKLVSVGGGTQFKGCDYFAIKLATSDGIAVEQSLVVDDSVTFDGAAINAASANRHLNCTGGGRVTANYSNYFLFLQIFRNVAVHGKFANNPNLGAIFLDGSNVEAVINFDRSKWTSCSTAIRDVQGTVSMCDMELVSSNIYSTSISTVRDVAFCNNRMKNSYIEFTKHSAQTWNYIIVMDNTADYSVNNLGVLRFINYGTDNGPICIFDRNTINLTGAGNTLAINGATSGTQAVIGANNHITSAAGTPVTQGLYLTAYELALSGAQGLYMPVKNGEITVVNTNATGVVTYSLLDSIYLPVGTRFKCCRTNVTHNLIFTCANGINGLSTLTLSANYSGGVLEKIASNKWTFTSSFGTFTLV